MVTLKAIAVLCLAIGLASASEERKKRQAYNGNYNGAAQYRQPQAYQQQPQAGYQQQPQGYQQQPQGYQQQSYGHQPAQQQYAPQPAHKPPRQQGGSQEEEKEQGPHPLNLLLENSKFECGSKSDGYYADSGVGCQAFHYCVSGQKHSMMCPAGTVFHQVHLNCVPQDQDICNKADKFYFVNDYLNKALEQKGPNNTVQYAHRYYPDNYAVGDPFIPPQETQKQQPPAATYGLGPAYREQQPAAPAHQGSYHPQAAYAQQPAHHQQPAPAHHPQNAAPYTPPAHHQAYQHRPAAPPQPARPAHHQQQTQLYGYGAQQAQAYNLQAQQAQRAYAQQQHQAAAPQQHLYGAGAGQRPRYA